MNAVKRMGAIPLSLALISLLVPGAGADTIEYFANGDAGRKLEIGGGGDGAFADGPAQTGISVAGANITFDTNAKSVYEFTSFTLSLGHTIAASGAKPLVIRVTGAARIAGTIHLDGANGTQGTAGAAGAGGAPGAGGGSGGGGGVQPPTDTDGVAGFPRAGNSIGGGGGPDDTGNNQNAGGGGCNGPGATAGAPNVAIPSNAAVCPLAASAIADAFETAFFSPASGTLPGGAGGGGGGTNIGALPNAMNGSGGGGAGGALVLTAAGEVELSGSITANGGNGGNANIGNVDYGASGGGGSGGSIWLQSVSRLSGAGTITVNGGTGGQDLTGGLTSYGGDGSRGVVRLDAGTNAFTGTITGGAVDRAYTVYPVTVEFVLKAGPACATIARAPGARGPGAASRERDDFRDFTANLALAGALVFLARKLRARNDRA